VAKLTPTAGTDLPRVPFEPAPFVVADIGTNQAQYGNQGILLNSDALKQALFGPIDGPPRNRTDRDARMSPISRTILKIGSFGVVMVLLTVALFAIFGQYRTGSGDSYSAVFRDASSLKSGDSVRVAGVRRHREHRCAAAGQDGDRRLRRRSRHRADHRDQGRRALPEPGRRPLPRTRRRPGLGKICPPGSQIPLDRTEPALDLDLLLGGLKPVIRGLNPQDVNALTSSLIQAFQGQGGTLSSVLPRRRRSPTPWPTTTRPSNS
jgi:hypothetical protein